MGRVRTVCGTVDEDTITRIILDNGDFTSAWMVKSFHVFGVDPTISTNEAVGTLAIDEDGCTLRWEAGDNRQIGWAGSNFYGAEGPAPLMSLIKPDHVVINDLWFVGRSGAATGADQRVNYVITIEQITLTDAQAVLQLIKERAQDDL